MVKVPTYNIEQFHELFTQQNALRSDPASSHRFEALYSVFATMDADLVGIVEGPTNTSGGVQSTVEKLESFAAAAPGPGLRTSRALIGFDSAGRQEIAVLFDP